MKGQKFNAMFQLDLPTEEGSRVSFAIKDVGHLDASDARGKSAHRAVVEPIVEDGIGFLGIHPNGCVAKLGVAGFAGKEDQAGPGVHGFGAGLLVESIAEGSLA